MLIAWCAPTRRRASSVMTRARLSSDEVEWIAGDEAGQGVQHEAQERARPLHLGGSLLLLALVALAFGDVAEDEDGAQQPAGAVADGGALVVDRALAAVAVDEQGVVGQPDDAAL